MHSFSLIHFYAHTFPNVQIIHLDLFGWWSTIKLQGIKVGKNFSPVLEEKIEKSMPIEETYSSNSSQLCKVVVRTDICTNWEVSMNFIVILWRRSQYPLNVDTATKFL